MQKNKRLLLTAAVSAALLFSGYGVSNAYTYSGVTSTVDKVAEDANDLVVTGKSNVTGTSSQNPQKVSQTQTVVNGEAKTYSVTGQSVNVGYYANYIGRPAILQVRLTNLPTSIPTSIANELINIIDNADNDAHPSFTQEQFNTLKNTINSKISVFNNKYKTSVTLETTASLTGNHTDLASLIAQKGISAAFKKFNFSYDGTNWTLSNILDSAPADGANYVGGVGNTGNTTIVYSLPETVTVTQNLGAAAITVSNASTLTGQSDITSGVSTTVTDNSSLTAKGNFTTPTLTVADSNVTVGKDATIASGGLKTTGSSKVDVSNGALTVTKGAVNIAKGGVLKAKVLKAAAAGTETSVIGSSTNIQGTLTVAGQVKGVTAGTATTDAVNKGQLDSAVNTLTTKISQGGKTYTAGSDIDISSANAISVKKAGLIASGNTGLVTGGTVYSTTNALNTQITATSQAVESLSDKISTYGKTISSISTSVTNTLSSMKNTQANFVDTSLSNISSDGKDVIKQVVKDVLAANTASTTSSTASAKTANLLKASFVAAPMRAAANLTPGDHVDISGNTIYVKADGTVASGNTGLVTGGAVYNAVKDKADKSYVDEGLAKKADISYVDQGLSQKVNLSDFTPVKQQVETNTSDISALKTGKADADGSNINVGSFTAKLNTGKVEKGNTGLVSGGTVYDSLQTKADVGYVNTMGLALDSEIKGTARGLHNEIQDMGNRLTKDINRVGAGSAALAALHPQDFNPDDKWDFAVGYGHYKNANASAVGAFYRPNAGTTVSLAATIGNGDPQVSAGVSFKIGMGKNVEKVMVNKDDYDKLNRKVESQAEENQEMKEAMADQNKKIQELEEAVKKLSTK